MEPSMTHPCIILVLNHQNNFGWAVPLTFMPTCHSRSGKNPLFPHFNDRIDFSNLFSPIHDLHGRTKISKVQYEADHTNFRLIVVEISDICFQHLNCHRFRDKALLVSPKKFVNTDSGMIINTSFKLVLLKHCLCSTANVIQRYFLRSWVQKSSLLSFYHLVFVWVEIFKAFLHERRQHHPKILSKLLTIFYVLNYI